MWETSSLLKKSSIFKFGIYNRCKEILLGHFRTSAVDFSKFVYKFPCSEKKFFDGIYKVL